MERFLKSGPPRTGLPPDIAAILATETPVPYGPSQIEIVNDDELLSLPGHVAQQVGKVLPSKAPPQPAISSLTPTPPPTISFRPVNAAVAKKPVQKKAPKNSKPLTAERPLPPLAPATAQPQQHSAPYQSKCRGKTLNDIPAEIRVEIYRLVLEDVTIHILPLEARLERRAPHPLTRVSKLVRNEVLPIIHSSCPIEAMITDFNFSGMLQFMSRIPPHDEKALMKNERLKIQLCTTGEKSKGAQWNVSDSLSLGRWLRYRADKCRLQPKWEYCGVWPGSKVESAIRRKISRMTEDGKKQELIKLGTALRMQRLEKPSKSGTEAS